MEAKQPTTGRHDGRVGVVVVEDDPVQLEAIEGLLRGDSRIKVLGACSCAKAAAEAVPRLQPEVVLVDLQLPDLGGDKLIRQLKPKLPACQFLALTVFASPKEVFGALEAGATGYLLKSEPGDRIRQAIVDIHGGEAPMSAAIARQVLADIANRQPKRGGDSRLSNREYQIVEMLAQGLSYKEIASATETGLGTIRTHICRIYRKLHVHNRTEAVHRRPQTSQLADVQPSFTGKSAPAFNPAEGMAAKRARRKPALSVNEVAGSN